ncbi:MAG: alpha/beta fold hydrolase [Planctomycetota bacterium]
MALIGGCGARLSGVVESVTFYVPSRQPFETPPSAEDVVFRGPSGATLHGWWLARNPATEPAGTVFFCHGNAGRLPDHLSFVEGLPDRGFDVFLFDYRGYGRSSPKRFLSRRSLLRDADRALDALLARSPRVESPVILLGHSMGAVIGSALIAERASDIDGAVLVAGFSSFPRVASDFGGPIGLALIQNGLDMEQSIARFGDVPAVIVHGGRDRVVRPYHAERIAASAVEAGVATQTIVAPEADHVSIFDWRFGVEDTIARFAEDLAR